MGNRARCLAAMGLALALLWSGPCLAAVLDFPPLTGRVVDQAHVLSLPVTQQLTAELAQHEAKTGQQVVVAVVSSLQGQTIEDYGYQLGRAWGIGRQGKDSGAILLVAPAEHKVRIEVGYGLEGTLTDAKSSEIINGIIVPDFKAGDLAKGVVDGTGALLQVLGEQDNAQSLPVVSSQTEGPNVYARNAIAGSGAGIIGPGALFFIILLVLFMRRSGGSGLWLPLGLLASQSWSSGGNQREDSFSGGGGSFGGGGASGSW